MACTREGCERPVRSRGLCHACYMRWLERQKAYGRFESLYVDAGPTRQHVLALIEAGVSRRRISELSGISRKQIGYLLIGRPERAHGPMKRITRTNADRLRAVPFPTNPLAVAADHDVVDATGTRRRLRALVAFGWPATTLVAELAGDVGHCTLHELVRERRTTCLARTARSVSALFDRLQFEPGPSPAARARGLRNRWPLPMEWDEDTIDDPTGTPVADQRWTRASTTAERTEAVQELTAAGHSAREIAERIGVNKRLVERLRSRQAVA